MRMTRLAPVLLTLLAGCASTIDSSGAFLLPPGGRLEGEVRVPAGSASTLRLANLGPGRADFVVRQDGEGVLSEGPLGEAETRTSSSDPVLLRIVVEAYDDASTNVSWEVRSEDGAAVRWETGRATQPE